MCYFILIGADIEEICDLTFYFLFLKIVVVFAVYYFKFLVEVSKIA
jgi:hypothetical protein